MTAAMTALLLVLLLSVAAPASGIAALARPALGGHKVAASRRRLEQQPVSLAVAFDGGVLAAITPAALGRDAASASVCAGAAWMWVAFWSKLAADGRIQPNLSRKIIHTGSAPLFMLCWPLFSPAPSAPILAGAVPLLQIIRLYRAGRAQPAQPTPVGAAEADDTADLVKAISRSGSRSEALGGPFLYTLVLLVATVLGWRSPAAAVAICQMAVGDGVADIVGRRYGSVKWPFSPSKSVAGSAAFVASTAETEIEPPPARRTKPRAASAFSASLGLISLFHAFGFTALTAAAAAPAVLLISLLSAPVELLPT
ncbi:hypothetical protein EMIHUDRAFT_99736 [Emiliania huxleyi CCMP1516]|uniref:phytol kinase n=2 Tax=Emiliania huxleyi TaxID=2903 RepID=A0A0D3K0N1_EMIH1|nr:hypothetical protein EMIHUDRAFT_99736 [Emiliania huxleyi CCMP1516]EOD29316.1 hypothetical protein EMIHUDRAFT_99736 [Emiliania huxleyi CCMP1516]|eukprot:XP_005781745.1 hypothetical protein EMIHUDRAFT_99736 [Emiliania huxleyi CCMP1516]